MYPTPPSAHMMSPASGSENFSPPALHQPCHKQLVSIEIISWLIDNKNIP